MDTCNIGMVMKILEENKLVFQSDLKNYITLELIDLIQEASEQDTFYKSIDINYSNEIFGYEGRFYVRYFKMDQIKKLVLANISANVQRVGVISIFEEIAKDFNIDYLEIECLSNYQIYLSLIKKNWITLPSYVLSENQVSHILASQSSTDTYLACSLNLRKALK